MSGKCWTGQCVPALCNHIGGGKCNCASKIWNGTDFSDQQLAKAIKDARELVEEHARLDKQLKNDLEELQRLLDEISPEGSKLRCKLKELGRKKKREKELRDELEDLVDDEQVEKDAKQALEKFKKSKARFKALVERILQSLEGLNQLEFRSVWHDFDRLETFLEIPYQPKEKWSQCSCEVTKWMRLKDLQTKIEAVPEKVSVIHRLRPSFDDIVLTLILDIVGNAVGGTISFFSLWVNWFENIDAISDVLQLLFAIKVFADQVSNSKYSSARLMQMHFGLLSDMHMYYRVQRTWTCLDKS